MKSADEIDRAKFETAVQTARRFLDRLEQHIDPQTAQTAVWTAVLERGERLVGREELANWLRELTARLDAEASAEPKH